MLGQGHRLQQEGIGRPPCRWVRSPISHQELPATDWEPGKRTEGGDRAGEVTDEGVLSVIDLGVRLLSERLSRSQELTVSTQNPYKHLQLMGRLPHQPLPASQDKALFWALWTDGHSQRLGVCLWTV